MLLVLDDFWAESFLTEPLQDGFCQCCSWKCDSNHYEHAVITYFLSHLPDDDCLNIFSHNAFGNRNPDLALMEIGEKIVRKCKGLPLSSKVLGNISH